MRRMFSSESGLGRLRLCMGNQQEVNQAMRRFNERMKGNDEPSLEKAGSKSAISYRIRLLAIVHNMDVGSLVAT